MAEPSNRTLVCSVLFLDLVEYSRRSVTEQQRIKQRFNAILAKALRRIPSKERVAVDTGDGAAIAFLGNPEDALQVSAAVRDAATSDAETPLAMRFGINLGPVRLVKDINGQLNIIGDGINVAQRVLDFAAPGQILAARSYYEIVSRLSEDFAALFSYIGPRTDKHSREHEIYAVVPQEAATSATAIRRRWRIGPFLASLRPPPLRELFHHQALIIAPLLFLLLVASGVVLRVYLHLPKAAPAAQASSAVQPLATETAPASPDAPSRATATAPAAADGKVTFIVIPWAEVVIDGANRGITPPLRTVALPPGRHTIELRNTTLPTKTQQIDVRPGQEITVRHRFN